MGKTKSRRLPSIIFWIIAIALEMFTTVSLFAYTIGRNTPRTNYGGILGYYLAHNLYLALGGMSALIPILAGTATILHLFKVRRWRRFLSFAILLLTILYSGSLLSFYSGLNMPDENCAGWTGYLLSTLSVNLFGLGSLAFIALGFYWGFALWFRRAKRLDITRSVLIIAFGFIWELLLTYFNTPPVIAGSVGINIIAFLSGILGTAGTLIALIAALAILTALTGLTLPLPGASPRSVLSYLGVLGKKLITPLFKKSPRASPREVPLQQAVPRSAATAPEAGDIASPVTAGSPAAASAAQPPSAPVKVIITSPPSRQPAKFNLDDFQKEFLNRIDQPADTDRVFKDPAEAQAEGELLMRKLKEFGVDGKLTAILSGPMVTRFELEPAPGVRCSGIESLADDIALALSAERVRILAPIPGKSAVGVEIPNKVRRTVYLKEVITSPAFRNLDSPLGFALGTTITGEPYCADLRQMPHILIAGTTGSGKSVCINSIITSIIYRATPDEVRFLTIDPKQLELPIYNPIPHLLARTTTAPELVVGDLTRIVNIMEARYSEFAELGVRDISSFNARCEELGKRKKPYIVVVIDELADLMQRAPTEIEARIIRLAQMSRAVGIHLILATQRPSVDVITGLIKANFPCRIAFQVATKVDSRTILDANGAESLLGRGDMLFLPPGKGEPVRLHGCFVSERAAKQVVDLWAVRHLTALLSEFLPEPEQTAQEIVQRDLIDVFYHPHRAGRSRKLEQLKTILDEAIIDNLLARGYYEPLEEEVEQRVAQFSEESAGNGEFDTLFAEAARLVVMHREASVSMLQRRLDVGWARAGRIIDQLERAGIVGPHAGSKPRKVLIEDADELEKKLAEIAKRGDR